MAGCQGHDSLYSVVVGCHAPRPVVTNLASYPTCGILVSAYTRKPWMRTSQAASPLKPAEAAKIEATAIIQHHPTAPRISPICTTLSMKCTCSNAQLPTASQFTPQGTLDACHLSDSFGSLVGWDRVGAGESWEGRIGWDERRRGEVSEVSMRLGMPGCAA